MPHEHVILLEHTKLNSPHILGELQTLFTSGAIVQCSFKATIDIVRIFDNEWVWKFIIEFAHESWKPFEPADLLSQWNKVALTDNLDGLHQKWFNWTCHYFNYWREWVRREYGMLSRRYHTENKAVTQAMIEAVIDWTRWELGPDIEKWEHWHRKSIELSSCCIDHSPDCIVWLSWQLNLWRQVWWDLPCRTTWQWIKSPSWNKTGSSTYICFLIILSQASCW